MRFEDEVIAKRPSISAAARGAGQPFAALDPHASRRAGGRDPGRRHGAPSEH